MKVLISGSHGLIGEPLVAELEQRGYTVVRLVRDRTQVGDNAVWWDPENGQIDQAAIPDVDVVIHLAGENVAEGRWNDEKMRRIRDSRTNGTQALCKALAERDNKPRTMLSASAIGFYGSREDQWVDENARGGGGFLAEVCRDWEAAADIAAQAGIRVAKTRLGMVLSAEGGALTQLLGPFKMGLGGSIGSGTQYISWISITDAVRALLHIIDTDTLSGPVNVVAPNPVQNKEFGRTLGRVLHRPAVLPMSKFMARTMFGEMADELLLVSQRVKPQKLQDTGFEFTHIWVEQALRDLLDRP